jgi:hypothetical protein
MVDMMCTEKPTLFIDMSSANQPCLKTSPKVKNKFSPLTKFINFFRLQGKVIQVDFSPQAMHQMKDILRYPASSMSNRKTITAKIASN